MVVSLICQLVVHQLTLESYADAMNKMDVPGVNKTRLIFAQGNIILTLKKRGEWEVKGGSYNGVTGRENKTYQEQKRAAKGKGRRGTGKINNDSQPLQHGST